MNETQVWKPETRFVNGEVYFRLVVNDYNLAKLLAGRVNVSGGRVLSRLGIFQRILEQRNSTVEAALRRIMVRDGFEMGSRWVRVGREGVRDGRKAVRVGFEMVRDRFEMGGKGFEMGRKRFELGSTGFEIGSRWVREGFE